ncbi:diguanylate cyclase [Pseudomonas sp. TH05]|uniref:diguanylate cyclase domain-containing protein n=1 Tax=unclassified Pseudomonas TaxID=196821 RepID=UPI001911DA16|nr:MULTISPECIES: diguanylate cyclase [unclassified Pseudomonas]MBK5542566.1 diguanylate cyclase [Pseudomonas sp. TH07]MBK5554588.1 diguanylate cyclase [Pseudomonas sp. TH05]
MNDARSDNPRSLTAAQQELAQLRVQTLEVRATLARLQDEVVQAQRGPANTLLEANQELVIRLLRAQDEAQTAAKALHEISHSIGIDDLTNLPNRRQLLTRIEHAIANAVRLGDGFALLFLDLNDFKVINDRLGHGVGDAMLKQVAQCLKASVRETDTVSRYGGDEFLILLNNVSRKADATRVVEKIISSLSTPYHVGQHELSLKVSIGICLYPDDAEHPQQLIDQADAAMYRAKRQGSGGFEFHDPHLLPGIALPAPFGDISHDRRGNEAEHLHIGQLREANEQLVMAALSAQQLQSGAEQAFLQQKDLLAKVAHELRNPLTPLSLTAGMLLRLKHEELPRIQAIIERQVRHMSRLVEDLVDVSRVSAGKLRLDRQPIDLGVIITEALETCHEAMELRRQQIRVQLPKQEIPVNGDSLRLAQIFGNLLGNASKYTPLEGEIALSVHVVEGAVEVIISDTGIGISAAMLPFIFEPYVQDVHAMKFDGGGLGIGLTVVRELVLAHDGHVSAHSAGPGLGSQFVVKLPLLGCTVEA